MFVPTPKVLAVALGLAAIGASCGGDVVRVPADPSTYTFQVLRCVADTEDGPVAYQYEITNLENRSRRFDVRITITDAEDESTEFPLSPGSLMAPGETVVITTFVTDDPIPAPASCAAVVLDSPVDDVSGSGG